MSGSRLRLVIGPTLLVGLLACGQGEGAPRSFLSLGTGGTGGVYYPLGGALASRLSAVDSLRQFTAEVTGGSVENANRIIAGQIDLGFVLSVTAHEAFNGGADFATPARSLRVLAPLYDNVSHVLVPRGSTAQSIADLAGLRVSVGSAGSGTEQVSRQLLEIHGLTYDDIDARYLSFTESSAALRDGAIDAAIMSVGIPAAAILEATTTGGVRILGIDEEALSELRRRYPYYSSGVIPGDAYPGMTGPVTTAAMTNWIVGDESLDRDIVTELLTILGPDRVYLEQVHDMAKQIDLARLADAPIPLHAATEAFQNERR